MTLFHPNPVLHRNLIPKDWQKKYLNRWSVSDWTKIGWTHNFKICLLPLKICDYSNQSMSVNPLINFATIQISPCPSVHSSTLRLFKSVHVHLSTHALCNYSNQSMSIGPLMHFATIQISPCPSVHSCTLQLFKSVLVRPSTLCLFFIPSVMLSHCIHFLLGFCPLDVSISENFFNCLFLNGPAREKNTFEKTSLEREISFWHNLIKKWGFVLFYDFFFMYLLTPCVPFQVFPFFLFSGTHQWMGMYEVRYFFPCHCFNLMTSVQPSSTTKLTKKTSKFFLIIFLALFAQLFLLNLKMEEYRTENIKLEAMKRKFVPLFFLFLFYLLLWGL